MKTLNLHIQSSMLLGPHPIRPYKDDTESNILFIHFHLQHIFQRFVRIIFKSFQFYSILSHFGNNVLSNFHCKFVLRGKNMNLAVHIANIRDNDDTDDEYEEDVVTTHNDVVTKTR